MPKTIPCYFCPTNVVLVNEDIDILQNLFDYLTNQQNAKARYTTFSESKDALHFLNDIYVPNPFANRYVHQIDDINIFRHIVDIDFNNIYKEIFNQERFNEISVAIVDYNMKEMNGLEFFSRLKDENIKKILIIPQKNTKIAIQAFNEGLINGIIFNDSLETLFYDLVDLLNECFWSYFCNLSNILTSTVKNRPEFPVAWKDKIFIKFFKNMLFNKKICEFYLLESVGSFLLIDESGHNSGIFVQNLDQQTAYLWEVQDFPEYFDKNTIEDLKKNNKIFCFFTEEEKNSSNIANWKRLLKPSQQIIANNIFNYSFVDGLIGSQKNTKILTFKQYLNKNKHSNNVLRLEFCN